MLFSATILTLILGTAVSIPWQQGPRHQKGLNPFWQGRSSLTQGFLCDGCVVGVGDAQALLADNLDQIQRVLNRTSFLCKYCPVQDQCYNYFQTEIPAVLEEFVAGAPNDICTEVGLCDENATIQGMVIKNLKTNIARDRVIKRMLMRARVMQQKMIRLILGPDYLCSACEDILKTAREMLLNNETQHEVTAFLLPLCDYLPTDYRQECSVFVHTIPALLTEIATNILVDSTCSDLGFCNSTKVTPEVTGNLDILSHLGLPGVLPVVSNGQSPFQFPNGRNPFQFPTRGQNPFQFPGQSRPGRRNLPFMLPGQSRTRPQQNSPPNRKWPTSTHFRKTQQPNPRVTTKVPDENTPDLNLDDIFSKTQELLDRVPSLPELPNMRLPSRIPIAGAKGHIRGNHGRQARSLTDWIDPETILGLPEDIAHEYVPDPLPDLGFIITEEGADKNCEMCKVAVVAVDTWLRENAPEIQKKISKVVKPLCKVFPSPMKEDCSSDVTDFVATLIQKIVSHLQPEPLCTWAGVCSSQQKEPIVPHTIKTAVWNQRFP